MTDQTDEQKSWACLAKALDEFDGDKLIVKALHCDGEFCAVGAALKIAKVNEVTQVQGPAKNIEIQPLYNEFQRRFKLLPASVYIINDGFKGSPEARLIFMRHYARLRSEGVDARDARIQADELTWARQAKP